MASDWEPSEDALADMRRAVDNIRDSSQLVPRSIVTTQAKYDAAVERWGSREDMIMAELVGGRAFAESIAGTEDTDCMPPVALAEIGGDTE